MAMATSSLPLNFLSPPSSYPYSTSQSLHFLILKPQIHFPNSFRTQKTKLFCSAQTIEIGSPTKKKRKPRPSFLEQIQEKWSSKTTSLRETFPWQEEESEAIEEVDEQKVHFSGVLVFDESESGKSSAVTEPLSFSSRKKATLPPWVRGNNPRESQFDSEAGNLVSNGVQDVKKSEGKINLDEIEVKDARDDDIPLGLSQKGQNLGVEKNEGKESNDNALGVVREFCHSSDVDRLPWEREGDRVSSEEKRLRKSNSDLAEKVVPEPELKRLRNVALRMVERIKVGAAGVTQSLVDSIHEKWKDVEVVKLKLEGPSAMNVRRTHEVLESRTGGLVIWRSGSSVVLYRGMAYKLDCAQSYYKMTRDNAKTFEPLGASRNHVTESTLTKCITGAAESSRMDLLKHCNNLSGEELQDLNELNLLLDELGPRYKDWSGREPLPVDADLLPAVLPGYRRPFRLLPHGIRQGLRDKEMTYFRRIARTMPPHFALGRNRELQGLAMGMVKLWQRSALAKIAIKRGVHNTCNERMAEELKVLTGGTLLSRNKEYIVFYRGNDFMPSGVAATLVEKEKLSAAEQDEEEKARQRAVILNGSNAKVTKGPLVAGTLSETKAATLRWSNQASNEDLEKMRKELAVARHASLVKFLEKKLAIAKGKITKAEKALRKVQEKLEPAELPTDLETLSDEERFLFRKIGLSMKTYLLLGRRGIFDGTIENMHLHWKYRELVKIIVEGKSLPLVKHIAISLEAESGGVLVSVDKSNKGYIIIIYRGKNYQRPSAFRPKNLLTKRQALAHAIELQRREALKHHVSELQEKIQKLKSELEDTKFVNEIDEETLYSRIDAASDDDDLEEDEGEEAHLETYNYDDKDGNH